jgi:hypothetical protein
MSTNTSLERVGFDSLGEAMKFAEMIAKSTMVPKDYVGKAENVLVAVMMGAELGLKPFQAIQNIAVINGRPSIWGDATLGLIQAHQECEYVEEEDLAVIDKQGSATCKIKRKGQPLVVNTFNLEMAKKAGLLNKQGPWTQYPARMLKMRARAFSARDAFSDVLKGINIAEEAQDMPVEKDITPTASNAVQDKINQLIEQNNTSPAATVEVNQSEHVAVPATNTEDDGDLSIVINKINQANTIDELKATKEFADMLANEEEKTKARNHYHKKRKELKEKFLEQAQTAQASDPWVSAYDNAKQS